VAAGRTGQPVEVRSHAEAALAYVEGSEPSRLGRAIIGYRITAAALLARADTVGYWLTQERLWVGGRGVLPRAGDGG
jgi:hypothetical protein